MNTSPDRSEPDIVLEEAVFQMAEEVKRLRESQSAQFGPGFFEGDVAGFLDQENFKRFEELLRRALSLSEPQGRSARWVDKMAPQQREVTLVLLEMLTGFFEAYRELAYRVSDLSRFCFTVQNQMSDLKRLVLEQTFKTEEQFARLAAERQETGSSS